MIPATIEGCSGWFHPAAGHTIGRRGMVLVPALGFEELCSRRTLRILAERLAGAGIATLRFDFHGTADSLGSEKDPGRLTRWTGDIGRAIDWLRRHAAVDEVGLIGLRFGALVAADVAAVRGDVAMLALLAPPSSGKAHMREQAALARIIAVATDEETSGITVAGFHFTKDTVAAIKALDWPKAVSVAETLIVAPKDTAKAVRDCFPAAETVPFTGYERMICDPTASEAPFAVLDRIVAWARRNLPAAATPAVASPVAQPLAAEGFSEQALTFGPDRRLAGILCRPRMVFPPVRAGLAVILINGGGLPHTGWVRMTVTMARALAERGIASLRIDFSGIGDSRAECDEPTPFYYDPANRREIVAAVDRLQHCGFTAFAVSGICSGAHHAFHAALADHRISALVLVNLQCFIWGPRHKLLADAWMKTQPANIASQLREADEELSAAKRQLALWKQRLLSLARRLAKPAFLAFQRLAGRWAPGGAPIGGNTVAAGFRALSRRGAHIALVYSEGDPALDELSLYMGAEGREATQLAGIEKRVIAGADHAMRQHAARAELLALKQDFLGRIATAAMRETGQAKAGAGAATRPFPAAGQPGYGAAPIRFR
ncbi:MAG: hypothetical protein J0H01_17630 [Rhizobiales bacterium]|nr:hypothetical protein [Hyphomicrobiales bacterium]